MPNATILLADNDEVFLHTTREYLRSKNFNVLCAKDPEEARHILDTEIVALALIDYRLRNDLDDFDDSGYQLACEVMKKNIMPRVILTQFDKRIDPVVNCLKPDGKGRAAAKNYIFKRDGWDKMYEAINEQLTNAKIFLCYAHADSAAVKDLYNKLMAAGFCPWMDSMDILPGEKWDATIRAAMRSADFSLVCVSRNSIKRRGFIQKEIKLIRDLSDEQLEDDIYSIPVRLEECEILDEELKKLQWVNLYEPGGFQKLVAGILAGMERRRNG